MVTRTIVFISASLLLLQQLELVTGFASSSASHLASSSSSPSFHDDTFSFFPSSSTPFTSTQRYALTEDEEEEENEQQPQIQLLLLQEEESRIKILNDRRRTIRGVLKAAESTKNFRIANGYSASSSSQSSSSSDGGKSALTITAFVVAGGAVLLRIGGRAALVSTLGLDFATNSPELQTGLDTVLNYADSIGVESELALFILAWTVVKVLCFDAGGVVLALASGILFGGVIQGAVLSALAATVGSSAAFGLAKLPTPVRQKALDLVEEFPSLRGIEKVVAKDGLKAILTLRLAPVLPIPIGLYNYVYGVTNVPYWQFAGGVFLGSLKPYLLDSYLGVFGKQIVDGTASGGMLDDALLLVALGFSVLIGVFASQLANETWESINEEIEVEKAKKTARGNEHGERGDDDNGMREFMGIKLPQWMIGFQSALSEADKRVNALIEDEYHVKVWNYTTEEVESASNDIIDPATQPDSPEVSGANKGFDFGASLCEGLVLSPALFRAYVTYADPLYTDKRNSTLVASESDKSYAQFEPELDEELTASPSSMTAIELVNDYKRQRAGKHTTEVDDILMALGVLRARLQEQLNRL